MAGVCLATAVATTACRQPEGPLPTPRGEAPNKLQDIGRDIGNVSLGHENADQELFEDVSELDGTFRPAPLVRALIDAVVQAVGATAISETKAHEVARLLFVVVTAEGLNADQIETLGADLAAALKGAGADGAAADRAATAATALQSAITLNVRRWYHLF